MGSSMARKSRIQESLDRAAEKANRDIITTAISDLPSSTTIKELHGAMAKSPLGATFETMTLADLRKALGGAASAPRSASRRQSSPRPVAPKTPGRKINTRTLAGRAALDTAVRDFLRANGTSRSEHITPKVPGDTAQVRQSLKRMIENGEVVVRGNRRASEYSLTKGSSGASASASATRKRAAKKRPARKRKK